MDLRKFAQIALKDIRLLFNDRATLLIIIVSPLVLTFVIGAALSGVSGSDSPIKNIPVVVVNHDAGTSIGPSKINFGDNLTSALNQTGDLLKVGTATDDTDAETQVKQGKATLAILIPANFSETLNSLNPAFGDQKINLVLFRDAGAPISADIPAGGGGQVLNGFANANIAVSAGAKVNPDPLFLLTQANAIAQEVANDSRGSAAPMSVNVVDSAPNAQAGSGGNLLQYFAPAMAVFFLNFAMAFGAVSIIEEKENGTLQRLLASPTRRMTILAGKLGGTYAKGLIQITDLIIGKSIFVRILGSSSSVWGTNIPALVLLTLIVVAASIGFGTMIAAMAKTRQQAQIYTSAIMIVMGLVGGAFTPGATSGGATALASRFTVNYWGTNAYFTLAQTGDLTSILPNIVVLLGIFVVCFSIGVYLFNRRLDV